MRVRHDGRNNIRKRRRTQKIKLLSILLFSALLIFGAVGFLAKSLLDAASENSTAKPADQEIELNIETTPALTPEPTSEPTPEPTSEPTPEPTPVPVQITISAAGDCTLGTDEYFDYSTSFNAKYEAVGDSSYFFKEVRHVFEADDLTIVNFEGTLTESAQRKDKTYAFKGKPEYASILTKGSVEAVNLANNHSFDYGDQSYEDTKKYLTEAGITSFGYDRNAVIEVKGVSIGLIGIYELPYGIDCAELLRQNILNVKEDGAQLIIVSFHWGTEKENYPDSVQKELAHIAIDEGAHLVLGHHPHVLQGIEEYKGRNIVYSLGNFCFGGNKNPSDKDTMIFQQTFTIMEGVVQENNVKEIIPCSLSSRSDHNNYQPMVLSGEEKERVMNKILMFSEGLSS